MVLEPLFVGESVETLFVGEIVVVATVGSAVEAGRHPQGIVSSLDLLELGFRAGDTVGVRVGLIVGLGVLLVTTTAGLGLGILTVTGLLMGTLSGQKSTKRTPVISQYVDGISVASIPVLLKVKTSRVGMSPISVIRGG